MWHPSGAKEGQGSRVREGTPREVVVLLLSFTGAVLQARSFPDRARPIKTDLEIDTREKT